MNESIFSNSIPVGPLNLVVMNGCEELGDAVDRYISEINHIFLPSKTVSYWFGQTNYKKRTKRSCFSLSI